MKMCYYTRWHAIRKPKLWQIEQSSSHNQVGLMLVVYVAVVIMNLRLRPFSKKNSLDNAE